MHATGVSDGGWRRTWNTEGGQVGDVGALVFFETSQIHPPSWMRKKPLLDLERKFLESLLYQTTALSPVLGLFHSARLNNV